MNYSKNFPLKKKNENVDDSMDVSVYSGFGNHREPPVVFLFIQANFEFQYLHVYINTKLISPTYWLC